MGKVYALLAALGLGLALLVSPQIAERLEDSNRHKRELEALRLQEQQYQFDKQRQWDTVAAPANAVLYYVSGAGIIAALVLLLQYASAGAARRARSFELVNVQGLPLPRHELETSTALVERVLVRLVELDKAAAIADASRALPPHSLTYSPRISGGQAPLQLTDEAAETALASVPTFGDLLQRGDIAPGRPLVLGSGASGLVSGGWKDLYSTLVAGQSGSGKSTTQRFFASQAALHGARFVVIDPHADAGEDSLAATLEPLQGQFLCEVASDERAILDAVKLINSIGQKRLHGQDTSREPILVWVDEATSLLAHSKIGDELAGLLEVVAQQLRKVGIYASVSAQIVTASRTGGDSALRDSMASVICHKMRRSQARLILPLDDAQVVERLEPGRAMLWRTSGASELIGIPQTTSADCLEVASRLRGGSVAAPWRLQSVTAEGPGGAGLEPHLGRNGTGSSALERGETPSAEAARVYELFAGGADIAEIVRTIHGIDSKSGSTYQRRSTETQALLRQLLRQSTAK